MSCAGSQLGNGNPSPGVVPFTPVPAALRSVAAAISGHGVLGTSSVLDEGDMRTGIVPMRGTAAGSTMLDEAAFFHHVDA